MSGPKKRSSHTLHRLLAYLLFEKGATATEVGKTLLGHVDYRLVKEWKERFEQMQGFPAKDNTLTRLRLPVPPIDFDAITIDMLDRLNRGGRGQEGCYAEDRPSEEGTSTSP